MKCMDASTIYSMIRMITLMISMLYNIYVMLIWMICYYTLHTIWLMLIGMLTWFLFVSLWFSLFPLQWSVLSVQSPCIVD
jgi:hypothetical protein